MTKGIVHKVCATFTAAIVFSGVLLLLGNGGSISWLPPMVVFSLVGASLLAGLATPIVWKIHENRNGIYAEHIQSWIYAIVRTSIAFTLASFGWKKVFGLQFIVPAEISTLPMNQQSGEWLTWFYFGFSPAYGLIIAFLQIAGSMMLLFRRTTLIGAIVLFSLMVNLAMINIFYGLNLGALLQSLIVTIGLVYLISADYKRLVAFFFKERINLSSIALTKPQTKNAIRFSVIVLSLLFTLYLKFM